MYGHQPAEVAHRPAHRRHAAFGAARFGARGLQVAGPGENLQKMRLNDLIGVADHARLHRPVGEFFPVQTPAIIGILDHPSRRPPGHGRYGDADAPAGILAGRRALLGGFDAMRHGVADEVRKRHHHGLHHLPVHLHGAAGEGHFHLDALLFGGFPGDALQLRQIIVEGAHGHAGRRRRRRRGGHSGDFGRGATAG